ncbi:methyltransferase domain-containing protein [Paraburkholderia panacisoli]|nr:class I SAM-dependent methyltransferase [Paraburkholderia panacisoli]
MDRREKMLAGIDLTRSVGAEIGALCNPLVTKDDGDIIYVDYADADSLRKHYAGNPSVDVDKIVETDAIWGKQTLAETLKRPVDFIVASHVIEHVPDLITWLRELRDALTADGQVRLAIPDKRFTFDLLRRETELSDVLDSYVTSARVPKPHAILDYYLNATPVDPMAAWRGELNESNVKRPNNFEPAMAMARDAAINGTYHDAHCWVFTPRSFANLMEQLSALELVQFACDRFINTEFNTIEFFVSLRPETDTEKVVASWQRIASEAREAVSVLPSHKVATLRARASRALQNPLRAISSRLRGARVAK